ncbi:MAG: AbrB/MazE/SpoVT family DNA-binding domain-containing protein [Thermoplasmata archaeon]|nr:AbrB/MazE/SpoVT family DNA-binding domain-containing protein [Thermoplasmata archaeon]
MANPKRVVRAKTKVEPSSCCGDDCCEGGSGCCGLPSPGCCKVEAIVGVDARGQMVLPKDLRDKLGIAPNDKLAVVAWSREDKVCCLTLLKVDQLADAVRETYGPLLNDMVRR